MSEKIDLYSRIMAELEKENISDSEFVEMFEDTIVRGMAAIAKVKMLEMEKRIVKYSIKIGGEIKEIIESDVMPVLEDEIEIVIKQLDTKSIWYKILNFFKIKIF
jgi:hypothetical protein